MSIVYRIIDGRTMYVVVGKVTFRSSREVIWDEEVKR